MAALSDFHFDEDGWVRSTCLHREGLPVLLWEVLQEFGHTEPPQYYGRVSFEGGISGWEAICEFRHASVSFRQTLGRCTLRVLRF